MKSKFIIHKPSDYFFSIIQLINGYRTRGEQSLFSERDAEVAQFLSPGKMIKVLDLANGRLQPQYILLKADGYHVVGIDIANHGNKFDLIELGYRIARWLFKLHVQFKRGRIVGERLVCGDVGQLPFANDVFDMTTSIAAFEHFMNVPKVVAELHRVLCPGGIAYIRIHLFTSLSGGHNINSVEIPLRNIPNGVDAWDHLRKRHIPFRVPLNEWRVSQYLEAFSQHFEIVKHYCAMREGEHLLTSALADELSEYTQDELTCGAYVIIARKPC